MDIRSRQRLLIIHDMMYNLRGNHKTIISSGSMAEGLDLPGSDIDAMCLFNDVDVIESKRNIKHPIQNTTLLMESDIENPGFTRLRLIAVRENKTIIKLSECCENTSTGEYVSVNKFLHIVEQSVTYFTGSQLSSHGPCFSDTDQHYDLAFCLRSKRFPNIAIPWVRRHRRQWPPNVVIDKIVKYGCLLVAIGPRTISDTTLLWRLSFSMAEKQLSHSFNYTQFLCYGLLKLTLKRIINKHEDVKDLLCSYFLKTALFWISEEVDFETFQLSRLFHCFFLCLDKLIVWINKCYCPNYFIPQHNMFLGKIDQSNNTNLQNVLGSIKSGGIDGLIHILFPPESGYHPLLRTELDIFVFKTCLCPTTTECRSHTDLLLQFAQSLQIQESSTIVIDICKFYYGFISQYAAQLLPPPTRTSKSNNIHTLYHRHLQEGVMTDAVSGWLLYASYFYVIGKYNVTLRITEYVLSRCKHGMLYLDSHLFEEDQIKRYRQNVHSKLRLRDKLKLATVRDVTYICHSSLIPEELQLEVEETHICLPPIVLSRCLRFLCHHHLGNIFNRQLELHNLFLTAKYKHFVSSQKTSDSLTVLGRCYEISGDKLTALQWYQEAVQCEGDECFTAKARRKIILSNHFYKIVFQLFASFELMIWYAITANWALLVAVLFLFMLVTV
ncbi:uncharacterized protein LOC134689995 [Mytilus trossulus]|uniref:uncharacterized protein LOC134689995 n=1 Tax=Mytilus trossulus TaxID=6551 RepID=UPI003007ED93